MSKHTSKAIKQIYAALTNSTKRKKIYNHQRKHNGESNLGEYHPNHPRRKHELV